MVMKGSSRIRRALAALLLGLVFPAIASGQNMFYREVEKDGRIYAFARMKDFETWDKSGEIGKAITRIGYGPKGETVVFDSEDAINLYNFKHNLPGEVFAQPKEGPKSRETAFIKVGTTIYTQYAYQDVPRVRDADQNSVHLRSFEVTRAYINVTGNISDWISYRVTPDVAVRLATTATGLPAGAVVTTSLDGSLVIRLKYAFGQVNFDKFMPPGSWARLGQQQTPFVDFMEGIYRYRFQGPTFEESEGFLSSSDLGFSAHGVAPKDYGDVHVGYYNGDTYTQAEFNDQKAFQIRGTVRPLPKANVLKGLRITGFYDNDSPVRNGNRDRTVLSFTFENKHLNMGYDYLWAKDRTSVTRAEISGQGWTLWATPRTPIGLEALIRYDHFNPNTANNAVRTRFIGGIAYWLKVQSPLAAAILVDYEEQKFDASFLRPNVKSFKVNTLFNY